MKSIGIVLIALWSAFVLNGEAPPATTKQVDVEVIELNRYGFYPKQISRTKGEFFLYVRNVTGLRNFSLRLLRQNGQSEKQKDISETMPHWKDTVDLAPGTYTLTEATHPAWTCTITVR